MCDADTLLEDEPVLKSLAELISNKNATTNTCIEMIAFLLKVADKEAISANIQEFKRINDKLTTRLLDFTNGKAIIDLNGKMILNEEK